MKKLFVIIAAAVTAFTCVSCGREENNEEIVVPILETNDVEYRTVKAEISDVSEKYYQEGSYGYPYYEYVKFNASGQIETINVETNAEVKEGDLLCTLNTDAIEEQIEEKEFYLNQAQRTLETLQANNGSSDEIRFAEIDLEIQQLEYDHLVESLEDYNVYAPCDGVFSFETAPDRRQELNVYTYVNEGQIFGYAVDRSQEYLCCEVYDNPLTNVNFGTKVILEQGVNTCDATVTDIIYNENGEFSTYVYVLTPTDDSELLDFGEIQVCFDVYSRLDTVVVPTEAVKTVGERTFANLLIDGVKVEQDVELGIEDGDVVEIVSGLTGDEELILN